jgi:cardiolipin synthase A/B
VFAESLAERGREGSKVHELLDWVGSASSASWGPLLSAGAIIAEFGPTMYHGKILSVDGLLASVGSTNFDNRSFRLGDEATLNIVDKDFASAQTSRSSPA